jgi:hypothetical protein
MNTKGSSYILVLVIVMTVFLNLSIAINISKYQNIITEAYNGSINNYEMAVSGIEKTTNIINRELHINKNRLYEQLIGELVGNIKYSSIEYKIDSTINKQNGTFSMKNQFIEANLNKIAYDITVKSLDEMQFIKTETSYLYTYNIYTNDEKNKHEVIVIIKPINIGGEYKFDITSTANNSIDGKLESRSTVTATIKMNKFYEESTLYPNFKWETVKKFLNKSIYASGSVQILDDASVSFMEYMTDIDVNINSTLNDTVWSYQNPTIIMNYFTTSPIDVSKFYVEGQPIPTIILNNTNTAIRLYSSDSSKNDFIGIIFSKEDIAITGINIEGSIVCLKDISISSSGKNLIFKENKDMIFTIRLADSELYYKILDYLNITNFNKLTTKQVQSEAEMKILLGNLNFSNTALFDFYGMSEIKYDIFFMKEL